MQLNELAERAGVELAKVAVEFRKDGKRYVYFTKDRRGQLLNDGQSMSKDELREWLRDREELKMRKLRTTRNERTIK
jgi:hypothetical protein